jgi:molybdenum cofactor cytidylyltransferase
MKFGPVPVEEAEGALLAHSTAVGGSRLKKGQKLSAADVRALAAAGFQRVTVARLDPTDIPENDAAQRLAHALASALLSPGVAGTGRCNLYARAHGLAVIDGDGVNAFNASDEAITLATVNAFEMVDPGQIAATVKIIPFAASRAAVERCTALAQAGDPILRIAPFRSMRAGLIQTRLPGLKPALLAKTEAVTRARLATIGSQLVGHTVCDHDENAVSAELQRMCVDCDLVMLLGASAIVDRRDVIPAAVENAGGSILHFGMPVDPGNLTLLARLGRRHVLGLPGSARSTRIHGFDFVLQRLAAGLEVGAADVMRMGVGGLLKEIRGRPLPRARAAAPPSGAADAVAAIVLAAGSSTRMRGANKLLAEIGGKPLLRRVVERVLAAHIREVVVVTGHEQAKTESALGGLAVRFVHNPAHRDGLSTSLRAGIAALSPSASGALVCLADMPEVDPGLIMTLLMAFSPEHGKDIVVPVVGGRRGNPVVIGRRHFAALARLTGDIGARPLIERLPEAVVEVEVAGDGAFLDLDDPEALDSYTTNAAVQRV